MPKNSIRLFVACALILQAFAVPFNVVDDTNTLEEDRVTESVIAYPTPSGNPQTITDWHSPALMGLPTQNELESFAVDQFGNTFVAGSTYQYPMYFGNHTITWSGNADIFVAKLNYSGEWDWAVTAGGSNSDYADNIVVDSNGSVYVTGRVSLVGYGVGNRINFGSTYLEGNSGYLQTFVAKINSNGSWDWVSNVGYQFSSAARNWGTAQISLDSNEDLYIATVIQKRSYTPYKYSIGLAKFSNDGTFLARTEAGTCRALTATSIAIDDDDNVFVGGRVSSDNPTSSTCWLQTGGAIYTGSDYNLYVMRASHNPNGNGNIDFNWGVTEGSAGSYQEVFDIAIDADGDAIIVGHFDGNFSIGSNQFVATSVLPAGSSSSSYNCFIAKLDTDGNWDSWAASSYGGVHQGSSCYSVSFNSTGYMFVRGVVSSSTTSIYNLVPSNQNISHNVTIPTYTHSNGEPFVMVFDDSGNVSWPISFPPYVVHSYDFLGPIIDSNDDIHYAGTAVGGHTINFGNHSSLTTNSTHIGFLIQYRMNSTDFDNDGLINTLDHCAQGVRNWNRSNTTDIDYDGCKDTGSENSGRGEDIDDDGDSIPDSSASYPAIYGLADRCPTTYLNWTSAPSSDYDGDGCRDLDYDDDDDDDGVFDGQDDCPLGAKYWSGLFASNPTSYDYDSDGCIDQAMVIYNWSLPGGNFYYSSGEEDFDDDNDGFNDTDDACPKGTLNWTSNPVVDYDSDGCHDSSEDVDDDNDGQNDAVDDCQIGLLNWTSNASTDHDSDGCNDSGEDDDDDNDGMSDISDACSMGDLNWTTSPLTDYDSDGCQDSAEDYDDDNDGITDGSDDCQIGILNWISNQTNDHDRDGCLDSDEDDDDDNDGVTDLLDDCAKGVSHWTSDSTRDHDSDGCKDSSEDSDDDNDGIIDTVDTCITGELGWISSPSSDYDQDGCRDASEDGDDDNDNVADDVDDCPTGELDWLTSASTDNDSDGCKDDSPEDLDDDNDGISDVDDECSRGWSSWSPTAINDYDSDGCHDLNEDEDDDNDGIVDVSDDCPKGDLNWESSEFTDNDGDGCRDDSAEDSDDDNDMWPDNVDAFRFDSNEWLDHDGDSIGDNADTDDDSDGIDDLSDYCPWGDLNWTSSTNTDHDSDGCRDDGIEDDDDDNDGIDDFFDDCPRGNLDWGSSHQSDYDGDGCLDYTDEDDDDDNDGDGCKDDLEDSDDDNDFCLDSEDDFPLVFSDTDTDDDQIIDQCDTDDDQDGISDLEDRCPLIVQNTDFDCDEILDPNDDDDDNDGLTDNIDDCAKGDINWISRSSTDHDADGCRDEGEDTDDDNDSILDDSDNCPRGNLGWISSKAADWDQDGCSDSLEDTDDDNDGVLDAIEIEEGTDPLDPNSKPAQTFSIVIGAVELGAWDLLGIVLAILTGGFLVFAFVTREARFDRFSKEISNVTRREIESMEKSLELSSFIRLISPRQSIKLENLLDERKYQLANVERIESQMTNADTSPSQDTDISAESITLDEHGFEWVTREGKQYFRAAGKDAEWELWQK